MSEIMKIELSRSTNPNNPIDKTCLKNVESLNNLDVDGALIDINIYDDENKLLGDIEGCLLPDKAGFLITRFHYHEDDSSKKENILSEFINFIFDFNKMGQWILEIYIHILGSNIKDYNLNHLGFCPSSNYGASEYYRKLNPNFISIVSTLSEDQEAYETLINRYNRSVSLATKRRELFSSRIKDCDYFLKDPSTPVKDIERYTREQKYYQEAIKALGNLEKVELDEEKKEVIND